MASWDHSDADSSNKSSKASIEVIAEPITAFLSRYRIEAAAEMRWLQEKLQGRVTLEDADTLLDAAELKDYVRHSRCVLLLQTLLEF